MITISKYEYLKTAQVFHWATYEHYVVWITGENKRHKRTEVMLPRLVKKGKLIPKKYGKRLIYTVPRRKYDTNYEHGLGCTEGLVRFVRSKPNGEIIAERHLRGFGIVPEWGIRYQNKKLLLFEFCTQDNFHRRGLIRSKITRYQNNLLQLETKFECEAIVLFVIEAPRIDVQYFVDEVMPAGNQFFFTDYSVFKIVKLGDQFIDPVYIWGEDGFPYPLGG